MSMIETVARASHAFFQPIYKLPPWEEIPPDAQSLALQHAKACIAAMPVATDPMWGGLARDIVMWDRFDRHSGADLHQHLRSIGRVIPDWLTNEIPETDQVPPKGTVAACIWHAMIDVAVAGQ